MPTHRSHTHLQATQATAQPKLTNKYACPTHNDRQKSTGGNSTYKKLAVQWLNETLCFVSSSVLVDSFVLRNRQLLVAANRQVVKKLRFSC
jgi:hypothetical protein